MLNALTESYRELLQERFTQKQQGVRQLDVLIVEGAGKGEAASVSGFVVFTFAAVFGSLLGFGLGCLFELTDKTFHNPSEIIRQLNVPLLGHIPMIGQSNRYLVEGSAIEPIICSYHRPKSQVSEAFRAIRTALFFNTQNQANSVIQITSPSPGDGKSTLAANLAVSIAQTGKRVLLIDSDMRRPHQHSTFGVTSKEGFATALAGQSHWKDCVFEVAEIEGMSIMPCGSKPQNPAELALSPQVKELIDEMRTEYDFVIIDSPPLLAVSDACRIAAHADGVLLCISIKKNVRISAERSTEMLRNLGANCLGLVVNGVGQQSRYGSRYTYGAYRDGHAYNGYGYGYGYGYNQAKYYDDREKVDQSVEREASLRKEWELAFQNVERDYELRREKVKNASSDFIDELDPTQYGSLDLGEAKFIVKGITKNQS